MTGSLATLRANATDDVAVASVQFLVNGNDVGTAKTAPFEISWGVSDLEPKLAHRADLENAVSFRPVSAYFEGNLSAANDRIFQGDPKVTIVLPWKAGKAEYSVVITQRHRKNACGNHIVATLVRTAGRKNRSLVLWSYDDMDECCDG